MKRLLAVVVIVIGAIACRAPSIDGAASPSSHQPIASRDAQAILDGGNADLAHNLTATNHHTHALQPPVRPAQRCFPLDSATSVPRSLQSLIERSAALMEEDKYQDALVCAEEASRADPRSVAAHQNRALALVELDRLDEAEAAILRAVVLNPDDPETLSAAADLFVNSFAPSVDHSEIALELARRAQKRLGKRSKHGSKRVLGNAILVEGLALSDLGRAREALARFDVALGLLPDDEDLRYAKANALYELCRFEEARRVFEALLERSPKNAWTHNQLGLVLERLNDQKGAELQFATAQREAPTDFPALLDIGMPEFQKLVQREVDALPADLRRDLERARLETIDLPDLTDLTAEEPPLSPTIVGLFRGLPIGTQPDHEERVIVLYRKNLLRDVRTREELIEQIRTTLHHELGHLRGEDDDTLRARGLE